MTLGSILQSRKIAVPNCFEIVQHIALVAETGLHASCVCARTAVRSLILSRTSVVAIAVEFDDKRVLMAIEISRVAIDRVLAAEFQAAKAAVAQAAP